MFEVGKTYPTVNGAGNYTILKIVEGDYPIHAYDYGKGEFSTFTLEGQFQKSGASGKDLVQPMKIGQKLIDNEGDEWYLLPNNVVANPTLDVFGKIDGECSKWNDSFYSYKKA
jgi:hypothetical protein